MRCCYFQIWLTFASKRFFTQVVEKQSKSGESERPYCLYSPGADKAKGCYKSSLEPEPNLGKTAKSTRTRATVEGESRKKNSCDYAARNHKSKYIN